MKLFSLLVFSFFTVSVYCQVNISKNDGGSKPFVLGLIDELPSALLNEKRILNVYLPEGYNQDDTIKYSVVYLLDGSADEDFIHVVGLYQFNSFPWINRVPKSIIVGIATVDRRRDFTFPTHVTGDKEKFKTSGHSGTFISFIEQELKPYIEKTYKTDSISTIIGQSLGGLLATEILFTRPSLFNKYIIISPSLWWDNGSLLNTSSQIIRVNFNHTIDVYIGVGKEGLTPGDHPRVMEDDARLLAEKIKGSKSKFVMTYFDYLPQEDHATIAHQAIFNALKLLYPSNKK
jgi:predicted alpha/beta superfamily hydrolase